MDLDGGWIKARRSRARRWGSGQDSAQLLLRIERVKREITVNTTNRSNELLRNRNSAVAKSFYRQLRGEGFSHEQIIELSTTLLDLVTEDMRQGQRAEMS